jgi:hypothetical protein
MSSENEKKSDASQKLSLRRETVRNLGVRSGIKTGRAADTCTDNSATISCNGSGMCTCTMTKIVFS